MLWKAYRERRGSLFVGRRLEQCFGNWMAHYTRFKVKEGTEVSALSFMPHEVEPVTSFEEERRLAIQKKQSNS